MDLALHKGMHPRRRHGSVVVVLGVLAVLGILGIGSLTMSMGMSRRDNFYSIRENAFEAARAAAEEAALLVNNGKINVAIDESMGEDAEVIRVDSVMIDGDTLEYMGLPADAKPHVEVRCAIVSPDAIPKKPPLEQLREIQAEIESRGFVGRTAADLQEFWARVDGTDTVFGSSSENETEGIQSDDLTDRFENMTNQSDISKWGPRMRVKDVTDEDGNVIDQEIVSNNKLPELYEVWKMFYVPNADETGQDGTRVPSWSALKPAWEKALEAVGKDAASRMESCGSNPNLAMSHLVGDLQSGQKIASGTEVDVTSAFIQSERFGDNKTYLLEIKATMPYGEGKEASYTTYRLFQKSDWEEAVENMTRALIGSLKARGMQDSDLNQMFPPEPEIAGRDEEIPGSSTHIDPKKVVADPVFRHLPSTVGSRMYPYTVANAYPVTQL